MNTVAPNPLLIAASNATQKDEQFQCFGCGFVFFFSFETFTNLEINDRFGRLQQTVLVSCRSHVDWFSLAQGVFRTQPSASARLCLQDPRPYRDASAKAVFAPDLTDLTSGDVFVHTVLLFCNVSLKRMYNTKYAVAHCDLSRSCCRNSLCSQLPCSQRHHSQLRWNELSSHFI